MFVLDIPRYHTTAPGSNSIPSSARSTVILHRHSSTRTNRRRLQGIRALFSCIFPRSMNHHENRWNQTFQMDSKCKAIAKKLVVKTIGEEGIVFDDMDERFCKNCSKPSHKICRQISYRLTKSMDSDDDLTDETEDSACIPTCQKGSVKIGIPCFQVMKKDHDKCHQPNLKRFSRRSIDCSQECPICWESFKEKEKVCWSKNIDCRHGFHLDCMLIWLKDHEQCPICRCDYMRRKLSSDHRNMRMT